MPRTLAAAPETTETEPSGSMGIRLTKEQRRYINHIAERQCNTAAGIIRLAVQQFIANEREAMANVKRTGGKLPS